MRQPGILAPVPRAARYLTFDLRPDADVAPSLRRLREIADGNEIVVGIGLATALLRRATIDGLREHPALVGPEASMPSTPAALWIWLRGSDRGVLLHRAREVVRAVDDGFELRDAIDAFQYRDSRDLTGYEDGTENPDGDDAVEAAFDDTDASFVAVQRWVHDLDRFQSHPVSEQNHIFGRDIESNEELDDAPESAHVKRTAQEDFDPEAFVVRRSMPWSEPGREGLVFVAFGSSFDAFDALTRRMVGLDDGITDALFRFTRPVSSSTFWCPPMTDGVLDLSKLAI